MTTATGGPCVTTVVPGAVVTHVEDVVTVVVPGPEPGIGSPGTTNSELVYVSAETNADNTKNAAKVKDSVFILPPL